MLTEPKDISNFALPSYKGYFIPIGLLEKGSYQLTITSKERVHYRAELLSDHFDHFVDQFVCPEEKEKIVFVIDKGVKLFLRIRSKKPLHIIDFKIDKIE